MEEAGEKTALLKHGISITLEGVPIVSEISAPGTPAGSTTLHEEERPKDPAHETSLFWSIFNLWNDVYSPGTVGMGLYVAQSGLWSSIIIFVVFGFLTVYTLKMLFNMKKKYNKPTYVDMCKFALGSFGHYTSALCMFCFNFGGLCAQLLMFGQVVPPVLQYLVCELAPTHTCSAAAQVFIGRGWVLAYACIAFLPISFMKNIAHFKFTSFLSCLCMLGITFALFVRCIMESPILHRSSWLTVPRDAFAFSRPTLLQALGGISYIYVCHDLSFTISESLRKPTKSRYYTVINIVVWATVVFTLLIGLSSYFMFFKHTEANVLDNFPVDDVMAIVCRIALALQIAMVVPYSCFMPRAALEAVLPKHVLERPLVQKVFYPTASILTIGLGLGIAEATTDLGDVFELVGGISACTLAFILPPIMYIRLESSTGLFSRQKILSLCVLLVGVFILISSTVMVFIGIANKK